jgi:hypothetical protein
MHGNNTGISLYSYLHLKHAKTPCFSYFLLCFSFNKIEEQVGATGSACRWGVVGWGGGTRRGELAQIMYTHVSKSKMMKLN